MRGARVRYDREMCYYHLMNRVAGEPDYFPFGDVEKERFFQLVQQVSVFYSLELLSKLRDGLFMVDWRRKWW